MAPINDRHPEVPASSRASKDERPRRCRLLPGRRQFGPSPFEARQEARTSGVTVRVCPFAAPIGRAPVCSMKAEVVLVQAC